jgi:guanine nucleotide-binding protein subunit gamma
MSELKLRRLLEHNQRAREDMARPRIRVSEASASLIRYCKATKDTLVPSVWGPLAKGDDPYAPPASGCNCIVMWCTNQPPRHLIATEKPKMGNRRPAARGQCPWLSTNNNLSYARFDPASHLTYLGQLILFSLTDFALSSPALTLLHAIFLLFLEACFDFGFNCFYRFSFIFHLVEFKSYCLYYTFQRVLK